MTELRDLIGRACTETLSPSDVDRLNALRMFTLWPAYAAFAEDRLGSIEKGKLADLTVLSADILKIPAPQILETKAVMTVIGGEVVHSALR